MGFNPFRSIGDEQFQQGSKFRLNLVAPALGFFYVLSDNPPDKDNPTGLSMLYPMPAGNAVDEASATAARMTTGWYLFDGPAATERLWLVWGTRPIPEIAALIPLLNERELGRVSNPEQARSVRDLLARTLGTQQVIYRRPDSKQVSAPVEGDIFVQRLELQHV